MFCLNLNCLSQNLGGMWKGGTEKNLFIANPLSIRLELTETDNNIFTGVLHLAYKKQRFEHIKISGVYSNIDSSFKIVEDSLISYKKDVFDEICLGKANLKLFKTDTSLILEGTWKDKKGGIFKCPNIKISYEKLDLEVEAPLTRIPDVQKVIDLSKSEADSVKIDLYDNGAIDGDSITLFINELLVVENLKLKQTAHTIFINLNKSKEINKLILTAVNLGEIPPNTAYIVITTKSNVYRLNLTSTLLKDGVVEFQFVD